MIDVLNRQRWSVCVRMLFGVLKCQSRRVLSWLPATPFSHSPIMSRNPSPAPQPQPSARAKQKPFAIGITAGPEDAKYQAKYKELKRKVKDMETDNDTLHIKVMNAKLTIQRMKMERAILYERLSLPPASPPMQDRGSLLPSASGVPPHHPASAAHHPRDIRDHSASAEPDQPYPAYQEYNPRTRGPSGHPPPTDGRPLSAVEKPPPGVAPSPHMSLPHSPRRVSAGQEGRQRLPLAQQLPSSALPQDGYPRSSHASPPRDHDYPTSSHVRTRSQSSSRSRSHHLQSQNYRDSQYPESIQAQAFSPPLPERERSRQSDMRSMPSQGEPHGLGHHQHSAQMSPRSSTSDVRVGRVHPHQRMGPGTYINREREEYGDRHRDIERERDWDAREPPHLRDMPASVHSPHSVHRGRGPVERHEYPDQPMSSREEHPSHYYEAPPPRPYSLVTRSDTPGSASASGSGAGGHNDDSSRPDSRTQYYEHDRGRPSAFRLRPVTQPGQTEDTIDFVHESGQRRSGAYATSESTHPAMESRKRSRNDMDVDSENDVGGTSGLYSTTRLQEDRGSKRYQRERQTRRSIDDREDARAGPS